MRAVIFPQVIEDAELHTDFQMLKDRFSETSSFVTKAYGLGDREITFGFISVNQINATAKRTGVGYSIQISSALPQALRRLFARLLADAEVLSWLPVDGLDNSGHQELEVALGLRDQTNHQSMQADSTSIRFQVVAILADITINFVFMHELGHILAGHTDLPNLNGTLPVIKEFELVEFSAEEPAEQARAWEYEADIVGSGLMNSQIDALIGAAKSDTGNSRQIFGPPQIAVEQCLSLSVIALYCLFRYLRGASLHLNLTGSHPDPLIRAFCVRDALFQATATRHDVNHELFEELLSARFEEFDDALEAAGFQSGMLLNDKAIDEVNLQMSALIRSRRDLRHLTCAYRYIDWD